MNVQIFVVLVLKLWFKVLVNLVIFFEVVGIGHLFNQNGYDHIHYNVFIQKMADSILVSIYHI